MNEVGVLKQQNAVFMADFQLEREDRERTQSRLSELEEQLAASSQRIAILEDERQHLLTTVATTRHQVSSVSYLFGLYLLTLTCTFQNCMNVLPVHT